MYSKYILILCFSTLVSCKSNTSIQNLANGLTFSHIHSDYSVTDINNYGCEAVSEQDLKHLLELGVSVTAREIHDHYSISGCSTSGQVEIDGTSVDFSFEYGGIIEFGNGTTIGCAEACCIEGYEYCTYEKSDVAGKL